MPSLHQLTCQVDTNETRAACTCVCCGGGGQGEGGKAMMCTPGRRNVMAQRALMQWHGRLTHHEDLLGLNSAAAHGEASRTACAMGAHSLQQQRTGWQQQVAKC